MVYVDVRRAYYSADKPYSADGLRELRYPETLDVTLASNLVSTLDMILDFFFYLLASFYI